MNNMTLAQIAAACQGTLYIEGTDVDLACNVDHVAIDSRKIGQNGLFIATRGERVDGHSFINGVAGQGALGVVCEEAPVFTGRRIPYILVKDSLVALKEIAEYYRQTLPIKVIGITGSVGKTSTKEFIASVLSVKYHVLKTQGNLNNEVGLPLTVLSIRPEHEVAVLEMGISEFGEMHRLSKIARPDVCVITNIGYCHLENLKTRDGILQAKSEIFDYMALDARICLNGEDDKLTTIHEIRGRKPVFFGMNGTAGSNQIYATDVVTKGLFGSTCRIHTPQGSFEADVPLPGEHMVQNALAATCVGLELGLELDQIRTGIEKVEAVNGRSHIIRGEHNTIIDDCYNANPVSMKSAIDLLLMADTRTVAILGDMFELGEEEEKMHAEVGSYAAKEGVDLILCTGRLSEKMYKAAANTISNGQNSTALVTQEKQQRTLHFLTLAELQSALPELIEEHDTILVKASHAMGFEAIVKQLETQTSLNR